MSKEKNSLARWRTDAALKWGAGAVMVAHSHIAAGGCRSAGGLFDFTNGAPMHGFAAPKLPTIRVGVVGMGGRGKHFLPLDMDVYDLAATCCLCELTEKSSTHRSMACDIPDFTRGAWRINKPMGIVDIDLDLEKVF